MIFAVALYLCTLLLGLVTMSFCSPLSPDIRWRGRESARCAPSRLSGRSGGYSVGDHGIAKLSKDNMFRMEFERDPMTGR